MCGISGVIYLDGRLASDDDARAVARMTDTIYHRGPDQGAVIVNGEAALGNRWLAILDLSPAGALPMQSAEGDLIIAYNGEIYNHPSIRRRLEANGARYRTSTDTESILLLYREKGDALLTDLRGMFAFALWDARARRLLIARDRLGEKPLYYCQTGGALYFASEIKALLAHPAVPREAALDAERLALYLTFGYLPAPETAFRHIRALPAGHTLVVDAASGEWRVQPYWTAPQAADPRPVTPAEEREAVESVREGLDEAVRQCLLSDVPLGAFLSGGLDSSLVVALMRRHSSASVKTFSIGFEGDASYDETAYAERVARMLETEHMAFRVPPQALELAPLLVWHHDQPFGDSSAIPTYLVSKLTRAHVTVALTGDGGDELFAGYERFYAAAWVERLNHIPAGVWRAGARALAGLPEGTGYYNPIKRAGRFIRGAAQGMRLAYLDWIRLFSADQVAALLPSLDGRDPASIHFTRAAAREGVPGLMDANLTMYLPDDLLIKTDRSSMAVSLEARAPFLDHLLVERAAALPFNMKLRGRVTKYVLKQAARGLLPDDIIHRRKHGFGVPLGAWLRRDSAAVRDVLLSPEARGRGFLHMPAVERLLAEHAAGKRDHGQRLWALLTLEWWHRLFIDTFEPSRFQHHA